MRYTLKIHPAGGILFFLALLIADSQKVIASSAALLLHEGAHLAAMRLCGIKECVIEITPFGGMADTKRFENCSPLRRIITAAAGIAASAAAAGLCMHCVSVHPFWYEFLGANLSLAVLNALPAWPLDGARVLVAAASCIHLERYVKTLLSLATTALGMSMVALGLYGAWRGTVNFSLFLIGPYLCYAARAEIVSDKVRRMEAAEHKLHGCRCLPVKIHAAESVSIPAIFQQIIFQNDQGRYQMLAEVDGSNGEIRKWWTEREMLDRMLKEPIIDGAKK